MWKLLPCNPKLPRMLVDAATIPADVVADEDLRSL
jgi:hypothetical protein